MPNSPICVRRKLASLAEGVCAKAIFFGPLAHGSVKNSDIMHNMHKHMTIKILHRICLFSCRATLHYGTHHKRSGCSQIEGNAQMQRIGPQHVVHQSLRRATDHLRAWHEFC